MDPPLSTLGIIFLAYYQYINPAGSIKENRRIFFTGCQFMDLTRSEPQALGGWK
jgi:hypothetical protein